MKYRLNVTGPLADLTAIMQLVDHDLNIHVEKFEPVCLTPPTGTGQPRKPRPHTPLHKTRMGQLIFNYLVEWRDITDVERLLVDHGYKPTSASPTLSWLHRSRMVDVRQSGRVKQYMRR